MCLWRRLAIVALLLSALTAALALYMQAVGPGGSEAAPVRADDGRSALSRSLAPPATYSLAPPPMRYGPFALADPAVADRLGLRPETRTRIQAVVRSMDAQIQQATTDSVRAWRARGGSRQGPFPDFTNPDSPAGRRMAELRQAAAAKISTLLTKEEQARWRSYPAGKIPQPVPRPMPAQIPR